jgi:hypothetical protein
MSQQYALKAIISIGQRLATCHNKKIAIIPIAPTKNPYFIDRGIAQKGSNHARSVEDGIKSSKTGSSASKLKSRARLSC